MPYFVQCSKSCLWTGKQVPQGEKGARAKPARVTDSNVDYHLNDVATS